MKLIKGIKIYYGGDMANREGFGIITKTGNIGYGDFVDIKMEDGRKFKQLPVCGFSEKYLGHGGTRFVTKKAWQEWRANQIKIFEERLKKGRVLKNEK